MALFSDIPQFTRSSAYHVDIDWRHLPHYFYRAVTEDGLDVDPDFQRGYVWTALQKRRYIEFVLRGGKTGRDIYTNCPGWNQGRMGNYVLVDGKQRLDAVLGFLSDEFPVFEGLLYSSFTDILRMHYSFKWHVNDLDTRDEVLQWYADLNVGGTVHSQDEIDRVRALMGQPFEAPTPESIRENARLDRSALVKAREQADEAARVQAARPIPMAPSATRKPQRLSGAK